jgi:regulator of sirC expression with transglutaminase-like and TPR domain
MNDPRTALEEIGQLPDVEIDIAAAAVQLGRVDAPEADWMAATAHLSELAREIVNVATQVADGDLRGRATALAAVLSTHFGYGGDVDTYDDPANANMIRVINRRRGLPVSLGVLWLHCARAADWPAHGVDFPGHFLVALEGRGGPLVLDVFSGGGVLDARALRGLIKRVEGPRAELRPGLLQPMSTRAVLLRLQNNVKRRRLDGGKFVEGLSVVEDMLRIAPEHATLWQEAAVINRRLDRVGAALQCFERFLDLVPQGDAAVTVRAAMNELRTRLN